MLVNLMGSEATCDGIPLDENEDEMRFGLYKSGIPPSLDTPHITMLLRELVEGVTLS